MPIKAGDRLPDATFKIMTADGPAERTVADIFDGKTVVLFAVPGAFTPTCHMKHMPGFVAHQEAFRAKGVDTIACTAVNDAFVLNAWAKSTPGTEGLVFLADGNADFARAIDLALDASGFGLGTRSLRYAMLVKDRVVQAIHVEDVPSKAEMSSAEALLAAM